MMKTMKFPDNFEEKVDTRKINRDVVQAWVTQKIYSLVKFEDEILAGFVMENLQERVTRTLLKLLLPCLSDSFCPIIISFLIPGRCRLT